MQKPPDTPSLTRRDFLQVASAGLALAVEPGTLLAHPPRASTFQLKFDAGAIVSLKRTADAFDTEYVQAGRRLGDAVIAYRRGTAAWEALDTATFTKRVVAASDDGARYSATYTSPNGAFELRSEFTVDEAALHWTLDV